MAYLILIVNNLLLLLYGLTVSDTTEPNNEFCLALAILAELFWYLDEVSPLARPFFIPLHSYMLRLTGA